MSGEPLLDRSDRRHVFTVDVEEYFQVHAFRQLVHPEEWECLPSRVERSTERLLELLEEASTRATFFVLGWIADRHPDLVRAIADAGHEIASHGYWHERVGELDREAFRADVRESKETLERVCGRRIAGYRAPRFSLEPDTEWILEVLAEEGFRYDSSLMPARMLGGGGYPGSKRWPQIVETPAGRVLELPLTTAEWASLTVPAAGGAYLRHLPYSLVRRGFRQAEKAGQPGVFYLHPWELDPNQPRIPGSLGARVRHYRNLERTEERVRRMLTEFSFTSVRDRFGISDPPSSESRREADSRSDARDDGHAPRSRGVGS